MTRNWTRGKKPFDAGDYPALTEFFSAYLHQDFAEEYASAAEAAKGFLADASRDEVLKVKAEWIGLREMLRGRSLQEKQAAVERLGSAWRPISEADWNALDEILSHVEA